MLTKSQVKYIQSLNEKKFRQENGVFIAEGPKIINELLSAPVIEPVAIYATSTWWQDRRSLREEVPFLSYFEITDLELARISSLSTPNQVLGIFRQPVFPAPVSYQKRLTLLLEGIRDPGNFGTIVRIADWFGIEQIVASVDSVDLFNPKVVQSTMGSIGRVRVCYEELDRFIASHASVQVYASTLDGKPVASFGKVHEGFLLIGNESKGLSARLLDSSHHLVTIPGAGHAESLNAAVATGIILSNFT